MNFTKVISTNLNNFSQRVIKVLRYGLSDVQTPIQSTPYGDDSNPVKDMVAIYGKTTDSGKPVIIGYINKDNMADVGEKRIFSTDANGDLKTYVWLKNDGIMELGGDTDFMVRFSELKKVVDELQSDIGSLKSAFTTWIVVPMDGGAALKAVSGTWAGTPLTENIDLAKIAEIKTI